MNWKSVGLTAVATLTLTACGVDNNETGQQGLDNGVQQTRFGNTTDFPYQVRNHGEYGQTGYNRNLNGYEGSYYGPIDNGINTRNNGINNRNLNNQADIDPNSNIDTYRDDNNDNKNRYEVADRVADRIVDKVDGIDDAYVLTTDNNAYVAAELDQGKDEDNAQNGGNGDNVSDRLEREIRDAVKSVDNDIENVYVSTNPDFVNLTNNYVDDFNNGEPIEGFFDQMGEMIQRVFPNAR